MPRSPSLSKDRVVQGAVAVADEGGLNAVSMRNVGKQLGVEAMSLYHHIANKEALLDELADWFFTQVELPRSELGWRPAIYNRSASMRQALKLHPWALGLIESRPTPLPNVLLHHDAVLGALRKNGFSVSLAAHAFSVLDAYVFGFVLTELNLPFEIGESTEEMAAHFQAHLDPQTYPYLVENIVDNVIGHDYAYANEFGYGLDLILDGLQLCLDAEQGSRRGPPVT